MAENKCVVCGEIIPEGRQVCPTCEVMSNTETEELATEIYTLFRSRPMSRALARHLYDKGWRKQREGEWKFEHEFYGKMLCSNCKKEALANENSEYVDSDFCPNCGAKMKGGAE